MGTFASTIHIYTNQPIPEAFGVFHSFSDGWQTLLPKAGAEEDFDGDPKLARKLSKQLAFPVLYFWEFDSDEYGFTLYSAGKQVTVFSTETFTEPKGLYKLPPLIGYASGNKQRLSKILSCTDTEFAIEMLEEYFGVCLEVFYELLDEPEALARTRSDVRYCAYLEEEKRFTEKNAPIGLELVEEIFGKVEYAARFYDIGPGWHSKEHIFYLAQFHTRAEMKEPLPAVEFREGRLIPADEASIRAAKPSLSREESPYFQTEFYPKMRVTFTELAPQTYRGKTFCAFPRGYAEYAFDENDRLILENGRGGVAFMNADGELLAKCSMKGILMDYRDGYFLTDSTPILSPWEWGYNPQGVIRIYRIVERTGQEKPV